MVSNSEFLETLYGQLGEGAHGWMASFRGDPNAVTPDAWAGQPWLGTSNQRSLIDKRSDDNNYYSVARLALGEGKPRRSKQNFLELAALVADDADPNELNGNPTFVVETSPGNFQIGVLLDREDENVRDASLIDAVMTAMADAELISADASGNNAVRYARLPVGVNGKGGREARVELRTWNPNVRYSLEDALALFGIDLDAVRSRVQRVTQRVKDAPGDAEHGELVRAIVTGESYHDPLMKLSAKLVASGASGGAVVNHLRGLMDAARPGSPGELERWQSRYNEIPRMVQGAERFRPEALPPVTINLGGKPEPVQATGEPTPIDWGQLSQSEPAPAVFRLEGWMPARTTTLLAANGGVGKSNLSLQLAASLALGRPFLGIDTAPSRVLVLSAEDETRTVHFRLGNICTDLGASLAQLEGRLVAYDLTQADCVLWREGVPTARMQWLADVVERHQAEVVIIDNASDVFTANENDRAEVRGFMRCLNAIALHSGAAVLLLAHVDKASVRMGAGIDTNSTFSGSTAWNNSARSRWAMTRDGENKVVTLRHEKCNFGPLQEPINLEFDPAAKVFRRYGQVVSLAAVRDMLRNQQRDELFARVADGLRKNMNLSPSARAQNNPYHALLLAERMPKLAFKTCQGLLQEMVLDGLLEVERYQVKGSTKGAERYALTAAGMEKSLA